jgi:hypothetical protein
MGVFGSTKRAPTGRDTAFKPRLKQDEIMA